MTDRTWLPVQAGTKLRLFVTVKVWKRRMKKKTSVGDLGGRAGKF